MPTYEYLGREANGTEVKGRLRAVSTEAVVVYLSRKNIIPLSIRSTQESAFSWKELANLELRISAVTRPELAAFSRNMATMLDAGVPILKSLQQLARSNSAPKLKKALFSIIDNVQDGESLAIAMSRHSEIFSTLCISTIEIGENTGNLVAAFSKFSEYLEMEEKNSRQLKSALRYPKMVLFALGVAIFVINIMVVPSFKKLFESMHAQLPWATRTLMSISDFFTQYWFLILLFLAALVFLVKTSLKNPSVRYHWDRAKLSIPIVGPLFQKIVLTRIVWSLSLIIRSGIPILKALELVSKSTENAFLQQKVETIKSDVSTGKRFVDAAQDANLFDDLTMQMLMIAEESGKLEDILDKIASEYEKETEYALKRLGDSIEPIMLLVLGAMVAVLALAIFLPMWDMSKHAIK